MTVTAAAERRADAPAPGLDLVPEPPAAPPAGLAALWGIGLLVGSAIAPVAVAVVVVPVAAVAAASGMRAVLRPHRRPTAVLLVAAAALAALAPAVAAATAPAARSGLSRAALVAALALAAAAAVAALLGPPAARPAAALVVALPGAGAAALVLGCVGGGAVALALAAAACLWDLANAATGTGPTGGVVGAVVAAVSVAVLAVLFAAIADPPLSGIRPWILFALVALGGPAGVRLSHRVVGGVELPALRRLDAVAVAGPAWIAAAGLLLAHR